MKNVMGRAYGMHGGEERCIQGFGGETEGMRSLGRTKRRLEDNIKIDHKEVGCEEMERIILAHDRDRCRHLRMC
jgi:hypothetical protein